MLLYNCFGPVCVCVCVSVSAHRRACLCVCVCPICRNCKSEMGQLEVAKLRVEDREGQTEKRIPAKTRVRAVSRSLPLVYGKESGKQGVFLGNSGEPLSRGDDKDDLSPGLRQQVC